jgi:NADH-quinone oxidoreductase subunit L
VHESPPNMLVPLIILGTLAVVAGFVGVPQVLGGANGFEHFMSGVFGNEAAEAAPAGVEMTMMIVSVIIGVSGIALAWFMYIVKPDIPGKFAKAFGPVYKLLYNKYYIDEIYNFVFVDSIKWASTHIFWSIVDVGIIDGFVNALASLVEAVSRVLRRLQTGYYNNYAFGMAFGVLVIVGIYVLVR